MPDTIDCLEHATRIVAGSFSGPHCVEAAALTVEVGAALGYELAARPVSMFATAFNGQSTATGTRGRAFGEQYIRRHLGRVATAGEFEGGSPFQRYAGHMVVVSEELRLLMDPTFAQFKKLGDAAMPLFVSEIEARAGGRFWEVQDETLLVRYFAADDFMAEDFPAVRAAAMPRAAEIADHLQRAAGSASGS